MQNSKDKYTRLQTWKQVGNICALFTTVTASLTLAGAVPQRQRKEKRIYTEHKDTSQKLSQTSIILHIHLQDLQPLANLEKLCKCLGCWYLAGTYERHSAQSVNIALLLKTARAARKVIRALSTWKTQLTSSSGDQLQVLGGLFPH